MAARLLAYEVADICLGKPPLRSISSSSTIGDALAALKASEDNCISVWNCDDHHSRSPFGNGDCMCVGKVSMVDVICYLCKGENLSSLSLVLKTPVSVLLSKVRGLVSHVEPSASLLDAVDLILKGAQNLVVPVKSNIPRRKQLTKASSISSTLHNFHDYCWLTQEDVIRFLLSSIGLFSPIPALSVEYLGIISTEVLAVWYHSPASTAVGAISTALSNQTSVAVVDDDGLLIGEISPFTLACCDETAAAAITTLSAGDLMAYIDCGGPPEEIMSIVKARLKERNLEGMLEELAADSSSNIARNSSSSSSDDELPSPNAPFSRPGRISRSTSYSARMLRTAEAIVCHPGSSLVAVMIQAIAHRVNYVWVIEEDYSVVGIVTFANILEVFRDHLSSLI